MAIKVFITLLLVLLVFGVSFIDTAEGVLLSYDGIDYGTAGLDGQNGGFGWGGAWSGPSPTTNGSLAAPAGYRFTPIGGKVEELADGTGTSTVRDFASTIDMDPISTQSYYYSCLFRRNDVANTGGGEYTDSIPGHSKSNSVRFGTGSDESFATHMGGTMDKTAAGFIKFNTTYLLVGKFIANPAGTEDESFGILYEVGVDSVGLEPVLWDVNAAEDTGNIIERLRLFYGGNTDVLYDEFRLGTSWEDVTNAVEVGQVNETEGQTLVFEKDETFDTFTVSLLQEPNDVVTVTVNKLDDPNDDIDVSPTILIFMTGDWDTPQTVTVTANDDVLPEGEEVIELAFDANSIDPFFKGGLIAPVFVTVIDDDAAGVSFAPLAIEVAESGQQDQYTIVLTSSPSADVHVFPVDAADPNQVTLDQAELVFTTANWSTPQTVTVTAIDDQTLELDPHATSIQHSIVSGDLAYNGLAAGEVTVSILENECGAWGFNPMDFDLSCEVDLGDFILFALEWLGCTKPYDVGCVQL